MLCGPLAVPSSSLLRNIAFFLSARTFRARSSSTARRNASERPEFPCNGTYYTRPHTRERTHIFAIHVVSRARNPTCILPRVREHKYVYRPSSQVIRAISSKFRSDEISRAVVSSHERASLCKRAASYKCSVCLRARACVHACVYANLCEHPAVHTTRFLRHVWRAPTYTGSFLILALFICSS